MRDNAAHLRTRTRSVPLPHEASPRVPLSDRYENSETHANLDESVGWSATMSTAPRRMLLSACWKSWAIVPALKAVLSTKTT